MTSSRRASTAAASSLYAVTADSGDTTEASPRSAPGAQQRLGRHAGPEGALAPAQLALDERDLEAFGGELAGAHLAGRPGRR